MNILNSLYRSSLALLTDAYQLTMAYGYWKQGIAEKEAVFQLFFRDKPFKGGYAICGGLATVVEFLNELRFSATDVQYLATLEGTDQRPLFEKAFLTYLQQLTFTLDVDAIEEGTVVFPQEPLIRIKGPLLQCQLLETILLTIINFQTLIATKASRICYAAQGQPVLEFGLRRAQGFDGGLAASRAAYLGGCVATSNTLAGKLYDIPVRGTHAHSWVMAFESELEAFRAYVEVLPNNSVLLVDTYSTLDGVKNAIVIGHELQQRGHQLTGIRLDSGDLAYLSIEARKLLDAAGLQGTQIVASNDLDEHIITSLKVQGARIDVWGVGTKLATSYDQPALNGVYKMGAIRGVDGSWDYKLKLSEQTAKITTPGLLKVCRYYDKNNAVVDAIYDENLGPPSSGFVIDPIDATRRRKIPKNAQLKELMLPIFRQGKLVYTPPSLSSSREKAVSELNDFHETIRRFLNPHEYPVGLEEQLFALKTELILKARGI